MEYNLNNSSWNEITDNLGSGTTSTAIPTASFIQGLNILEFQESNSYSTKLEWTLYIDQGSDQEEYAMSFTYDSYGNVISSTNVLGDTTAIGYDLHHLYPTSITNALNNTIFATYDFSAGLLTSITDARGYATSFEYDILGRVTKKINPDSTELEAVYNDQSNSVIIYDELDNCTMRYYDGLCHLTKTEWCLSPTEYLTETYTYNYLDKLKTRTDSGGHIYSYEYDSQGRITKLVNPDSTSRQILYDDTLSITSMVDENQHRTEYHYNWKGNLVWVKEYTDSVAYYLTQYMHDDSGNLISMTDANGNTTLYDYDSLFGVTAVTYPDSTTESFAYDAVGNMLQKTDSNGTTQFMYDEIYQLIEVQYPDQSVFLEYDANGNRTSMIDLTGQADYTYDNRNRCTSKSITIEGQSYSIYYQYDAASRLVSMTYPDQTVITNEYDALNRLTAKPGYAQFAYNDDSLPSSVTFSNGVIMAYQYDNRDRPTSIHAEKNDTDLLTLNHQYDSAGNTIQIDYDRRLPGQQHAQSIEVFQYDWLNRLISAQGDYGFLLYSYDSVGNRSSLNNSIYTYNAMNELVSISDGVTFTYDDTGNMITKDDSADTWSYTYNAQNQLAQIEKDQQLIEQYEYDGDGHRIKKTEWIESLQEYHTRIYVYSGSNIIYEKNLNTNKEATYVYGPTDRIAKNVSGLTDYYHADHLGSTRLITDETGDVVTEASYTPFGESYTTGEEELFLYNGKEKDSTGLYYYGARYYDPEIGRFITRDPIVGKINAPQSLNRYVYCLNNPLKYVDPDGRDPCGPGWMEKNPSEGDMTWGEFVGLLKWTSLQLMEQFYSFENWYYENTEGNTYTDLGKAGVMAAIGKWVSKALGSAGVVFFILHDDLTAPFCQEMWNDPEFRVLLKKAEYYAQLVTEGGKQYEQALDDSMLELSVYIVMQDHGDEWREKFPELAKQWDEYQERKQSEGGDQSENDDEYF